MEELGQIELRSLQTLGNPADSRTSTGKITLTSNSCLGRSVLFFIIFPKELSLSRVRETILMVTQIFERVTMVTLSFISEIITYM